VDLFSAAWEVRHGAAMALRELLKIQGKYGGMKGTLLSCPRPSLHLQAIQEASRKKRTIIFMKSGAMTSQPNFYAFSYWIVSAISSRIRQAF
jgi:hypothetical protein